MLGIGIIHDKLLDEWKSTKLSDEKLEEQRTKFYLDLALAWETLTYDDSGAQDEWGLGLNLRQSIVRNHLKGYYQEYLAGREQSPAVQLAPEQVKIMDALTEAAGIPHRQGQKEFAIPATIKAHMDKIWLKRQQRPPSKPSEPQK